MSPIEKAAGITGAMLRRVAKLKTKEACSSALGHYFDAMIELGLVRCREPETYMRGRFRDLRTPVELTDKGLAAMHLSALVPGRE